MKNKLLGVISLGCSKNRLDTEGMLYALLQNGFEITEELDQADLTRLSILVLLYKVPRKNP